MSFNRVKPEIHIRDNIFFLPSRKHPLSIIETSQLMLLRDEIAVYSENRIEHINALCGQNAEFF
jgi:hypothetical protein